MDNFDWREIKNAIVHILILIADGVTCALIPAFVLSPHNSLPSGYLLSEAVSKANEVNIYALVSGLAAATAGSFYVFDKYYPKGAHLRESILNDLRTTNLTFIFLVILTLGYLTWTESYPYSSAVKERMYFLSAVGVFVIAKPYVYDLYSCCVDFVKGW